MDPGKLCHQLCGKSTLHSHVVFLFDFRGFAKKKNHEITMEVGGSRSHSEFCFVLENRPKIALNQYWYIGAVHHVYSVCTLDGGVSGWGELHPIFFGIFLTLQIPLSYLVTL